MTSFRQPQSALSMSPLRRLTRLAAAVAVAGLLAACQADEIGYGYGPKDQRPVSKQTIEEMQKLDMKLSSPVLMRIFKEENKFEVWKMNASGRYALLKSYDICKWSGNLGPKVREGDRQAPEGFYPISPGLMNPKSDWYLAFNTGFPNAYDRANGRTGTALMVHGSCSSRGCYAMTDPQIQEIYALAREAFRGGQKTFQLQAFPFRLTAENMAKHWDDPNMPFWKMLKEGYDTFELTRREPKVDVCGRKYVFNSNPTEPLNAVEACPADLGQPPELVASLANKAKADYAQAEVLFAKLEQERKVEEDKKVQLALAAEKQKAEAERQLAEAEARRIEAAKNPNPIARMLGAEPDPDADVVPKPVVVPPTGAPVPIADPRGPEIRAMALAAAEPPPAAPKVSAISRLFSFVTGEAAEPPPQPATAPSAIMPQAATAPGAIMPQPAVPMATASATGVAPVIAPQPVAPAGVPPLPVPAARPLPAPAQPVAGPAAAEATAATTCVPPAPVGTPLCPQGAAVPPPAVPRTAKDKSILDRIGSWF